MSVNTKLRKVGRKIASIDRRLGFLSTRLYFKPIAQDWLEVTAIGIIDNGTSAQNLKTGEEVYAHRYTVKIDRDWLDFYAGVEGQWSIAPDGSLLNRLLCDLESQIINDKDTFGTLEFRVSQAVLVEFPMGATSA